MPGRREDDNELTFAIVEKADDGEGELRGGVGGSLVREFNDKRQGDRRRQPRRRMTPPKCR